MTATHYLSDKLMLIFLNLFCAAVLSLYLTALGNSPAVLLPILAVWAAVLSAVWTMDYLRLKKKYGRISAQLKLLDQKYLICEMLDRPGTSVERQYHSILHAACKSMLEKVNSLKNSQREYKEYIEEWIHEVKTPITAIDLICRNHPDSNNLRIGQELRRIDDLVEQALYYARSENVEKDYFVREFPLFDALGPALVQSRTLLLEENVSLQIEETPVTVCTDEKWLTYIIGQILANAVKYRRSYDAWIRISAKHTPGGVRLIIEDNGRGIRPEDLPRIFDKGFTGSIRNGRKATGMGLYLCRKLCLKLGLSISADSVYQEGTSITIGFPTGTFLHPDRRD